ncbi:hypothetical protein ACQPT2_02900 [Erwinia amylovora]
MRELMTADLIKVSGATGEKLNIDTIWAMINSGVSVKEMHNIGLSTASEEKHAEWGKNVAGDAGYYYTSEDNGLTQTLHKWFFDGFGYAVS